jgi:hypothetical protein
LSGRLDANAWHDLAFVGILISVGTIKPEVFR